MTTEAVAAHEEATNIGLNTNRIPGQVDATLDATRNSTSVLDVDPEAKMPDTMI